MELGEPTLEPELSQEEILELAQAELLLESKGKTPESTDTSESDDSEEGGELTENFLVCNAAKGNPYRDMKSGKFTDAPFSKKMVAKGTTRKKIDSAKKQLAATSKKTKEQDTSIVGADKAVSIANAENKKLEKATTGSAVNKSVEKIRKSTGDYLKENGGDVGVFKKIDESWVGNDYKVLENHIKNGDSKEVNLMRDLQQQYFKANGITEVTVYRGVYGEQAKAIKQATKGKKSFSIKGDYASSFTGYDSVAAEYADGAAFTAPDKITDSVVIKKTFKVSEIAYSTQVAPFYAGNGSDEFIVSTPDGYSVNPSDVEVIK